jgi:hypothetical protein
MDRGFKWLREQLAEDGSFGETEKLFYTLFTSALLTHRNNLFWMPRDTTDLTPNAFAEVLKKSKGTTDESVKKAARWLAGQQKLDGGFGEDDRMFYAVFAMPLLNKNYPMLTLPLLKWMEKFGGENFMKEVSFMLAENPTNMKEMPVKWMAGMQISMLFNGYFDFEKLADVMDGVDKTDVAWRGQLATQRLSTQVIQGGSGFWRAQDAADLKVKKGAWENGEPILPRGVFEDGPASDFEATLRVLMQLMNL